MKTTALAASLLALPSFATAAISLTGPSSSWTPLGANYDFLKDQQTGDAGGDIVGNALNPGFFTAFDDGGTPSLTDGSLGFRVRLDDHGGNNNSPQFDRSLWVGIDANSDGAIDVFLGVDRQGNSSNVGIYNPGTSSNTSPNTTSIASTPYKNYGLSVSNYAYRPVDFSFDGGDDNDLTNDDTGDTDYYVSFLVPLADLVAYLGGLTSPINIDENTPLRYVLATSTQKNSLNQDLGGISGGNNSNTTWQDLGGFTVPVTPNGQIPEPTVLSLLVAGGLVLLRRRR